MAQRKGSPCPLPDSRTRNEEEELDASLAPGSTELGWCKGYFLPFSSPDSQRDRLQGKLFCSLRLICSGLSFLFPMESSFAARQVQDLKTIPTKRPLVMYLFAFYCCHSSPSHSIFAHIIFDIFLYNAIFSLVLKALMAYFGQGSMWEDPKAPRKHLQKRKAEQRILMVGLFRGPLQPNICPVAPAVLAVGPVLKAVQLLNCLVHICQLQCRGFSMGIGIPHSAIGLRHRR
jgi:hypothetical protein